MSLRCCATQSAAREAAGRLSHLARLRGLAHGAGCRALRTFACSCSICATSSRLQKLQLCSLPDAHLRSSSPRILFRRQTNSPAGNDPSRQIVVIGGGISGLTAALYLARGLPEHRIVLLEATSRLGGWIDSTRVVVGHADDNERSKGQETALLEAGPRSIRPSRAPGLAMLGLLKSLSLIPRLLLVPKTAPSAQNRFIYYPNTLQRLPSNLLSLPKALFLPSLKGILKGAWHDFRTPSRFARPKSESALEKERQRAREQDADESISTFIVRRMGKSGELLRDRLFSAVLHGIYAGSPHVLSVRSTLGALWKAEQRHGSPVRAALPSWLNKGKRRLTSQEKAADEAAAKEVSRYEEELGDEIVGRMKAISVYSLPEGVGEITQAIVDELERMPNAHFVLNAPVTDIVGREGRSLKLSTPDSTYSASRIVAAQPSASLDRSISTSLPWLSHNPGANVGVVNVIFPSSLASHFLSGAKARLLPVEGFGYLIPTATENEDGVLGVVFDSDSLPDQDVAAHTPTGQTPTKLTVMIGGPHWTFKREHNFPKEQELVDIAKRALHSHLGLSKDLLEDRSAVYRAKLQLKCIPHYAVGHIARMRDLDDKLRAHPEFGNGRLVLAGASYTGVSLNDCVLHARRLADRIIAEERLGSGSGSSRSITGLESFVEDRTFALQSGAINLNG